MKEKKNPAPGGNRERDRRKRQLLAEQLFPVPIVSQIQARGNTPGEFPTCCWEVMMDE